MGRRHLFVALVPVVLSGVLVAASGCGGNTAASQPSHQSSPLAAQTAPGWARVGISRVMATYLKPGRPAAIEFQVGSSQLQVFVLTQKPLTAHVLLLRSAGPTGSSDGTFTVVPMETWTRSIGGIAYVFTARSIKPGPYRLVLKGEGEVFTIEVKQR